MRTISLPRSLQGLKPWLVPQWGVSGGKCTCGGRDSCSHPGKHPKRAGFTSERQPIEDGDNVAILCGEESGVITLDIDRRHGGLELVKRLELGLGRLPLTLESQTQDGGKHLFFAYKPMSYNGKLPGVELKGKNTLVTIPPSIGINGPYRWINEAPIAELPDDWAIAFSGIDKGQRNTYLTHLGGRYYRSVGEDPERIHDLYDFLCLISQLCTPSLPDDEVRRITNSISRYSNNNIRLIAASNGHDKDSDASPAITEHYVAQNILLPAVKDKYRFSKYLGWLYFDGRKMVSQEPYDILNGIAEQYCLSTDKPGKATYRILGSDRQRKGVLNVLSSMDELKYDPESSPMTIHIPKGILNLRTKEITPLSVDNASIHCTNASYIPDDDYEPPELYLSHLRSQLSSECEVDWLNRYALYCLSGHTHLHILTVLKGNGLNGKSTWVSTIAHIMGSYAAPTPRDIVVASNREIERAFAELDGVRFSYLSEPNKGAVLNDGILKMLASIDGLKVQARKIFKTPYDVIIQAKILIDTNNFLMTRDNTFGMWRRIHIIPWNKRVANRDTNFIEKLYAIKDNIFTYLVNLEYPDELPPTNIMEQEANEEKRFNSSVESFINECCTVVPDGGDMEVGRIYKEYRAWCDKGAEHLLPLRIFARELRHVWPDLYYSDGKKEFFRNVTAEGTL